MKIAWLHIISLLTKKIADLKQKLLTFNIGKSILFLLYIFSLEIVLGLLAWPLYLQSQVENHAIFNQEGFAYSLYRARKRITLSTIGTLIIFAIAYLFFSIYIVFNAPASVASITQGSVDGINRYAWGEKIGWIDFGIPQGNVIITDKKLTGYAWSETVGWISLNCSNDNSCSTVEYGVLNNGDGQLSGYAWSEGGGWIDFNPRGGGVEINQDGEFIGYAWGENVGWIVFNCLTTESCGQVDYKVATDYRPRGVRPACNNSIDDDDDGLIDFPYDLGCDSLKDINEVDTGSNVLVPEYSQLDHLESPQISPQKEYFYSSSPPTSDPGSLDRGPGEYALLVFINSGDEYTSTNKVNLTVYGSPDAARMVISNYPDFRDAGQEPYSQKVENWVLAPGDGVRTVYVKFYNDKGYSTRIVSDSIVVNSNYTDPYQLDIKNNQTAKDDYLSPPVSTLSKSMGAGVVDVEVIVLQKFLNANGFVLTSSGSGSPGNETDFFGRLTVDTLTRFQEEYGISERGFVGTETRSFINSLLN